MYIFTRLGGHPDPLRTPLPEPGIDPQHGSALQKVRGHIDTLKSDIIDKKQEDLGLQLEHDICSI